jgi:hypothetical protein
MGPNDVQALIGQWVDIVGKDGDNARGRWGRGHDRGHKKSDRDRDRDRGEYTRDEQPQPWYLQQPAWWRQMHPWYPQMPWQAQQPWQQPWQQQPQRPWQQQWPYQPQPQRPWQQQWPYQPQPQPASAYRQPLPVRAGVPAVREHFDQQPSGEQGQAVQPAQPDFWDSVTNWIGAEIPGAPGSEVSPMEFPFLARAAVVDAPLPTQANRDILPMSTGVPIQPTQSAQITGRPQTLCFKIGRFMISNAGTAGGAADWIVNDIKIGNRSQFVQSGDVPGDLFAANAIDTFVRFETAQTAMDVVVVVTYIGLNESGCPFFGAMVGTAAV